MKATLYKDGKPWHVDMMMSDDRWVAEPKYNGVRCMVMVDGDAVGLLNRNGTPLASGAQTTLRKLRRDFAGLGLLGHWMFDGELVGDTIYLFDMIEGGTGFVSAATPFCTRRLALTILFDSLVTVPPSIRVAEQAKTAAEKTALLARIKAEGGEGIMLKLNDSPYVQGRTDRAGWKVKLTKDADFVVMGTRTDGKLNATLGVFTEKGALTEVGRCSLIGKPTVVAGDVVEVRYLYVGTNGRLVQPRLMRVRTDKTPGDCTITQLAA